MVPIMMSWKSFIPGYYKPHKAMQILPNYRKNHYFLLEVMVCIALFSICALPLLRPYTFSESSNHAFFEKVLFERKASNNLVEIKKMITNRQIVLDDILYNQGLYTTVDDLNAHIFIKESISDKENSSSIAYAKICIRLSLQHPTFESNKDSISFDLFAKVYE